VNEGNPAPAGTNPGHIVYQSVSRGPAGIQGGVEVGNPIANVVNSRSATGQKRADGAVGVEWFQELYLGVAEGKRRDRSAIG
jgi:hypothetical protein